MSWGEHAALHVLDAAWLVWLLIWIVLARHAKPAAAAESRRQRLLHLAPMTLAGVLLLWGVPGRSWLQGQIAPRIPAMAFGGAALTVAGLAFCVWARLRLGRNWSGIVTVKQGHELIRSGPYALARHPIYTGLLTGFAGTALAVDRWRGITAFAILLAAFWMKWRREEAFMRHEFGAAYDAYRQVTPALLPLPLRRRRGAARTLPKPAPPPVNR